MLLKFVAGLLLSLVFAAAMMAALGSTILLVTNIVDARGDWKQFVGQMRHYSDRWESTPDGSFTIRQADHPVLSHLALVAGTWMVALLAGYAIERLRRNLWAR